MASRSTANPLASAIKPSDLQRAQEAQLERWLQVAATGVFNDLAWGCLNDSGHGNQMSVPCEKNGHGYFDSPELAEAEIMDVL
ncbi:hypothetical protein BESB_069490 [Besnoitia besnoiti]|uniref:Uncharacterized protein n=1 Tax=Besnoitia besnoiti TaxID=94643 RepID=A0A2A9MG19_BESBE|nr:hypothetical protein BESB_069490 [Besnoitia besnoiti]PFH34916.1 hypothetical protein BESB_069490 [Besnoitia besnoiti]